MLCHPTVRTHPFEAEILPACHSLPGLGRGDHLPLIRPWGPHTWSLLAGHHCQGCTYVSLVLGLLDTGASLMMSMNP